MKVVEDSPTRIVKELTDGSYTVRLEIKKNPAIGKTTRQTAR
jgi:hypothetical protein